MAPFALLSGRRLAQVSELASPPVGSFVSARSPVFSYKNERESDAIAASTSAIFARSTDPPVSQIPQLPSATAGLVGFICFLVVGILIFGGWKAIQWRRKRKDFRKASLLPTMDTRSEKRLRPLILVPPLPPSPSVRWVPAKVSPWIDPRLPRKPTPSLSKDGVLSRPVSWSFNQTSEKAIYVDNSPSDPSSYPSSADSIVSIPRQLSPPPVFLDFVETKVLVYPQTGSKPNTINASKPIQTNSLLVPPGLEPPIPRVREESSSQGKERSGEDISESTISPTESAESDLATSECSSVIDSCAQPGFPKLVIVRRSFPVNLPDELRIKEGERLRVLREFKDGWTLCQRTSRRNPEKGAVPRCCLTELSIDTASANGADRRKSNKSKVYEKG